MAIKTLHLTNAFHRHSGGISTFYMAMLRVANEQKREMRLIVPGAEDGVEQVGTHGRIYFVRAPKAPLNDSYRWIPPTHYLYPENTIRRVLREERPDLIEVCDKYSLHWLGGTIRERLLKDVDFRPVMLGLSCERMDENVDAYIGSTALHRWFSRWYMHWLYFPFFDHHTAVSLHAATELETASRSHATQRGIWIRPMGVDAERFSPALRSLDLRRELLQRAGGLEGSTLLLYAGRLAPEKNLPLLIAMMSQLGEGAGRPNGAAARDFRLIVVGDGMLRESLQRLATEKAPGKVCFLEHITDRERLAEIYASSDLFVHPNPREPFGIAPLEAMASGLPLVGTNRGGITSFAGEANAWLAEPDASAFATAVWQALENDAARSEKVRAALVTAAEHNWDRAALAYFALYDAIHAKFWGADIPNCPAYAYSTPATRFSDGVIAASSVMAQTFFRTVVGLSRQTGAAPLQNLPARYVQMVPSVTGREEKQRPFCVQEGQT